MKAKAGKQNSNGCQSPAEPMRSSITSSSSEVRIPDTDDSDLFSDSANSSDDEADMNKSQRQTGQNSSERVLRNSLTDAIRAASEHNILSPKSLRRKSRMETAMKRVKSKKTLSPVMGANGPRKPKRKRSKLVIKKGEKTKVKMTAMKSIKGIQKLIKPTAVFNQQRCVVENGAFKFLKIENLIAKKGRGRGKLQVQKVPDPVRTNQKESKDADDMSTKKKDDEAMLDAVMVYLKQSGWVYRSRRAQFQLSLNGSLLTVRRENMVKVVSNMHVEGDFDEFTAGKIEEELLLSGVARQIEVSAMVNNSLSHPQCNYGLMLDHEEIIDAAFDIKDGLHEG